MKSFAYAGLLVTFWMFSPAVQAQQTFSDILVFGDSLSDTGNAFAATGNPQPPYFDGRYSNGPLWIDYFAERLGLPAPAASQLGGTNHAWASAESGEGQSPFGVPNVRQQVDDFLNGNIPRANELIVVWGGANDLFGGQTDPATAVTNIVTAVSNLAHAGGAHFMVPNLPPLSLAPFVHSLSAEEQQTLDAESEEFNRLLDASLDELQSQLHIAVFRVDIEGLTRQVLADPSAFGFTNVTDGALNDGVTTGQGYLIWDDFHPTTAAHKLIADSAYDTLGIGDYVVRPTSTRFQPVGH